METTVVNLKNSEYDVYIGRAGKGQEGYFGNPFIKGPLDTSGSTIRRYKDYFLKRVGEDVEFRERVHALKGKRLGCFCKPNMCHGDVIATYLNDLDTKLDLFNND